jgi:diguanylate cyclase (GGDEF)-like protein
MNSPHESLTHQRPLDADDEVLRYTENLIEVFDEHRFNSEKLAKCVAELESLFSLDVYRNLFYQLAHLRFEETEAKNHWKALLKHHQELEQRLRKNLDIRVSMLNYFIEVNRKIRNPKIIEMRIFQKEEIRILKDELTGLYNHRHFKESFPVEVERARKRGTSLSFIMIDVDDFKQVNDRYGHLTGDGVLVQLGEIFRDQVPAGGSCFRYGGEEFVILLPNYAKKDTSAFAEELRKKIAENRFVNVNVVGSACEVLKITVSMGISNVPQDAEDSNELLNQADNALYDAKAIGKNKVVFFSSNLRRHARYKVDLDGKFAVFGLPSAEIKVTNLSLGGIQFETAEPIQEGASIYVHIPLDHERRDILKFVCTIIHLSGQNGAYTAGGEILDIDNQNKERLLSIISKEKG